MTNKADLKKPSFTGKELIVVERVKKYYPIRKGFFSKTINYVKALDSVDLTIEKGETVGLVGESGSGKTTLGKLILLLERPTAGRIWFSGRDILKYDRHQLHSLRLSAQIIFQDPYSSLDPRKKVGSLIGEALKVHRLVGKSEINSRVLKLMNDVGLLPDNINRYPHEFSGGQRQRIGIARALSLEPQLIICDEPVSALDVSIQGQVINLLQDLQSKYNLSYLFISHDLNVVAHLSNRVAVMYLGQIVEMADRDVLFDDPRHPYTQALLSASPSTVLEKKKKRILLQGEIPSPIDPPSGCCFHTRCPRMKQECTEVRPEPRIVDEGHMVKCFMC